MDATLLGAAVVVLLGVALVPLAARTGAPLLLLFLAVGLLLGEDGFAVADYDDFDGAYQIGSVALAVILFAGGLETRVAEIRAAGAPACVLATVGVVLTTCIVALVAHLIFAMPPALALLLGAVVGSTDAAATFLLLQQGGIQLQGRVKETILLESGFNDPMAIFLTITFVIWVDTGVEIGWSALPALLPELARQLGGGVAGGVIGGLVLAWLGGRLRLPNGLYPTLFFAGALAVFFATQLAGGSGFLAVYIAGITITARSWRTLDQVRGFHEGLAWLAQVTLFIMLGLLVTPSDLRSSLTLGLVIAAVLIFLARPVAAAVCLAPFGFPVRQQLYVGWVGLRGAVPIFLAIIPVISEGPVTTHFFDVVFIVVIASLVLQGWTVAPSAGWLGVKAEPNVNPP